MTNSSSLSNVCENFRDCKVAFFDSMPGLSQNIVLLSNTFISDVTEANFYVYENTQTLVFEFLGSWAPIYLPLSILLCGVFAYTVKNYFTSSYSLLFVELITMIALTTAPITAPWKSTRFYLGLLFFASFLTIHSNIFDKIQASKQPKNDDIIKQNSETKNGKESRATPNNDSPTDIATVDNNVKAQEEDNTWLSIYLETACYIRRQHCLSHADPRISWKRLIYLAVVSLLVDFSTYLIKEFIPVFIQPQNQYFFISLIGGLWVLLSMDVAYCIANIFCDLIGKPIPYIYRHRHPFLSASISEFWGIRWNPIVGKLLQDSFYKPARRRGVSRPICMIICFLGSAVLHAYPQYLATYNLTDAAMMGGFFICQGFLILFEHGFVSLLGLDRYFEEHIMIKAGGAYTAAHFQWLVELATVVAIVSTCYYMIDKELMNMSILDNCLFILSPLVAVSGYALLTAHSIALTDNDAVCHKIRARVVLSKVIGWILTLSVVVAMLPLFCMPTLNALDTLHPRSYVAGSIIRTLVKAWNHIQQYGLTN